MAKMIEIELAHWIDPDIVERMYICEPRRKSGHTYYRIVFQTKRNKLNNEDGDCLDYFQARKTYTAIQANVMMKRVVNAQTKPPKEKPHA